MRCVWSVWTWEPGKGARQGPFSPPPPLGHPAEVLYSGTQTLLFWVPPSKKGSSSPTHSLEANAARSPLIFYDEVEDVAACAEFGPGEMGTQRTERGREK